jgi:hypothetical protein
MRATFLTLSAAALLVRSVSDREQQDPARGDGGEFDSVSRELPVAWEFERKLVC